jgi:hypothetical protein
LKSGSGRLFEPLIYHECSGQERPSAVTQLSNRTVWPDSHGYATLSTEATQLVGVLPLIVWEGREAMRGRTCGCG